MDKISNLIEPYEMTKEAQKQTVSNLLTLVDEGQYNPLELFIRAKFYEDLAKLIKSKINDGALSEAYKFNKDETLLGCKIVKASAPTILDFQQDEEYAELYEKLKHREKELRAAHAATEKEGYYLNDQGEVVNPPPVKSGGKEYLRIEFPKK